MTYPVSLKVDYPEKLSRLTTFFRIFMVIPPAIVLAFVSIAGIIVYILAWFASLSQRFFGLFASLRTTNQAAIVLPIVRSTLPGKVPHQSH